MCIITNEDKIADQDKHVYKVLRNKQLIFRDIDGCYAVDSDYVNLNPGTKYKAKEYNKGYGFSCFSSLTIAKIYVDILIVQMIETDDIKIHKAIIPKGSRYAIGEIQKGMKGEYLQAIRAEYLRITWQTV